MLAVQAILPYCANRRTTVPMYADAFGLLVFGALLTSYYRKPPNRQNANIDSLGLLSILGVL